MRYSSPVDWSPHRNPTRPHSDTYRQHRPNEAAHAHSPTPNPSTDPLRNSRNSESPPQTQTPLTQTRTSMSLARPRHAGHRALPPMAQSTDPLTDQSSKSGKSKSRSRRGIQNC
ncbi:hypothetical protein BCR33DRAFT_711182, partial [Rhizoclosmatium globosum]